MFFFVSCFSHAFASVHCCLGVTCWERADLLALDCDVDCTFCYSPSGILCQVWYLIVLFPDLCHLSYFHKRIYHECEGRIEKSVSKIAIWHYEACRLMTNSDPEGPIFLAHPHTNNGFIFLLVIIFFLF